MKVQVELIPSGVDEDGEEQHLELDTAIIDTLKPILREAVCRKVDEIKKAVIQGIVHEHIAKLSTDAFAATFQQTDMWGQKKGTPKSLAQIVVEQTKTYLETKVNIHGEARYDGVSRVQTMVVLAIKQACEGEIDKQLKGLRAEFAEQLAKKIAAVEIR